ncbi:Carbon starvation protein A [Oligella ureolytica]|uniref:Carbon starvation protein A n=1 Tax=Oligella ureolytica TaxID=90244 RepID=A0A378XEZ3_9BURK|nr:pyruvate/proton symporter CstA [Oligella ureolytica]QPT40644.1 carbon starvation protein CstA [Oligella ureolytica]SUA52315.1 Carbon starvation protein A [Oligella ureolytica]
MSSTKTSTLQSKIGWLLVAILGALAFGYIALRRGETINAMWLLTAAVCTYFIAYRFYSLFIQNKVLQADATRMTPSFRHNDGLDYVPTNKVVLFGHHFAAIAGAGPLVGPVLAAQMGYLPSMIWILAGVVIAGAVQDYMVLFVSSRRDARSLGELIKEEMGTVPGVVALIACFMIMIIILAVLAMIVVKALTHSPWGTFTVAFTIPLAIFMGIYLRYLRPGRILEASVIGLVGLVFAILYGGHIAEHPTWGPIFDLDGIQLTWALMIYGFIAAVLPVWLLLAPRDYLSTFLKIGVVVGLAVGIVVLRPDLQMPAVTEYASTGKGPVWGGSLFPFLFITIACGAVSGFHALISSGTTPKMLARETEARLIGYGGMLMESFVAMMALIAASIIDPGVYFAMNAPLAALNPTGLADVALAASQTVTSWGFQVTPDVLTTLAEEVGEGSIISRAGGAPTLAVGMAQIFHQALGGLGSMSFWYHFAILFEALFILTAVDAGTRSARFMLQDLLGLVHPTLKQTHSLPANLLATALVVAAWGYFLYMGVTDPLGGINMLWPLFGITNQMLAAMALMLCIVVLFKLKRQQYAWVPGVPAVWLTFVTMYAGGLKVFSNDPGVGFFAKANQLKAMLADGFVPSAIFQSESSVRQVILNNQIDGVLQAFFMIVVVAMVIFTIQSCRKAMASDQVTAKETPYEPLPANADDILRGHA